MERRVTDEVLARRHSSPAAQLIFGSTVLFGALVLVSDWVWQWSAAEHSIRWAFAYLGMFLIGGGTTIVVLGARDAVRRLRQEASAGQHDSEHYAIAQQARPTGHRQVWLGLLVLLVALAFVCDGMWPWSGADFASPWIPSAFGLVFILAAVWLIISGQRQIRRER